MEEKLQNLVNSIAPLDQKAMEKAQQRLDSLTKPPGSLGAMEEIVRKIAGITGSPLPGLPEKCCILMAADHGVVQEGVSAYPQEVTTQMVLNFLQGGAAMNVLAHHEGARLVVVDVGVAGTLPGHPMLLKRKVAPGTANMCLGPAMKRAEALEAIFVGVEVVNQLIDEGVGLVGIGEMGIGNTTPSTAIISFFGKYPVEEVVGRGTGVNDKHFMIKVNAIKKALAVNNPCRDDSLDVLAKIGGLEIAGMAGIVLGAAARRVPVVVDGFISGAAAIIAAKMAPLSASYLLASHLSDEPGHAAILKEVGIKPLLYMNLRLGEGTGAALAMNIIDASLKIMKEMATFDDAGVSGPA